jgi:hypothetical protein
LMVRVTISGTYSSNSANGRFAQAGYVNRYFSVAITGFNLRKIARNSQAQLEFDLFAR